MSPEHQVDDSGETLLAAVTPLGLPDHVLDELGQHDEASGEILLEEVGGNRRGSSEHPERTIRILDALMAHAPQVEDRQYAAMEKLEILFADGSAEANTEAERLISDLTTPRVLQEGPAGLLADMLAGKGDLETALYCYDLAAREFLRGKAADLGPGALMFAFPLRGRAAVREKLGYDPDEFDIAVRRGRGAIEEMFGGPAGPSASSRSRSGPRSVQPEPREGRQVLCARDDFALAVESGLLDGDAVGKGADAYFRAGERVMREQAREHPDLSWRTALFSVEEMREFARDRGGDASDRMLRGEWGESLAREDPRLRSWPPERNKPCWCASGRKYKKCCGTPSLR